MSRMALLLHGRFCCKCPISSLFKTTRPQDHKGEKGESQKEEAGIFFQNGAAPPHLLLIE